MYVFTKREAKKVLPLFLVFVAKEKASFDSLLPPPRWLALIPSEILVKKTFSFELCPAINASYLIARDRAFAGSEAILLAWPGVTASCQQ